MLNVHTKHVKYDLMDYVKNHLSAQERERVGQHLQKCSKCNNQYNELLAVNALLQQSNGKAPSSLYFSTILPRVRERLVSHQRSIWDYGKSVTKVFLPLATVVLLVVLLTRTTTDSYSDSAQVEALHQTVKDLNEDEIMQAVETEYAGLSLSPNQEVAAAGVAERMQGDQFLKSAISKQIENDEAAEIDIEKMISELDGEQIDQILSGLSERNRL